MINKYFIFIFGLILLSVVGATPMAQLSDFTTTTPQVVQNVPSEKKEDTWSEKQICRFTRGCLIEDDCYPFGYVQNEQYCGIDETSHFERIKFVNQSKAGENCTQDFQCKSNFCFNKKCISSIESLIADLNTKITNLELKIQERNKEEITVRNISKENKIVENQSLTVKTKEKERSLFEELFGLNKK